MMAESDIAKTEGQAKKPNHKILIGTVTSNKMQKTIVVEVTRKKAHPLYKRVISIRKKFYAHDVCTARRFLEIAEVRFHGSEVEEPVGLLLRTEN